MQLLLEKGYVDSEELNRLLEARAEGKADFVLVDVREDMEYNTGHIKGVDMLKPTSSFQEWAQAFFNETKDSMVILTCRTGSRSGQVQNIFKKNGHAGVLNHFGGIVTYRGEIER
ncbi:MAG: rhodanese-like domain-containing protein [Campylobacterota bacterium]|nr:rhodanese-like domain-containing protein [Campylobacterota bacterium]